MSLLDMPIGVQQEQVSALDTPTPEAPAVNTDNKRLQDFKTAKAAYIEKYNTGEDLVAAFRKYTTSPSIDHDLRLLSNQKNREDQKALNTTLEEGASNPTVSFTEFLWSAKDVDEEKSSKKGDINYQFVDSISGPEISEEQKDSVKKDIDLFEILESAADDFGPIDYVMDVASWLPPLFTSWDDYSLTGQVFNNDDYVKNVILGFKNLPKEEQIAKYPAIVEEFFDKLGPIRGKDALIKFIDPLGEEDLSDFHDGWKIFDAVDIATLGAGAVIKAVKLRNAANTAKVLKNAGDSKQAADINTASLVDEDIAEVTNVNQHTAASNAMPFDVSIEDPAYTKGMSAEAQASLQEFFARSEEVVGDILSGDKYIKEGILNTTERANKEAETLKKLKLGDLEEIKITGRSENTTTFSYKYKEDGEYVDGEHTLDLTLNDAGQWTQDKINNFAEYLGSPLTIAKGNTKLDVNTAQRIDLQTSKVYNELVNLQREALKPLGTLFRPKNRDKLEKLNKVLIDGDEWIDEASGARGKVFTIDELRAKEFDEDMIDAYYRSNRMFNHLWAVRNDAKRQEMIARGFKKVNIGSTESSFGRMYENANDARLSVQDGSAKAAYNSVTEEVVALSPEDLARYYEDDLVLTKLADPYDPNIDQGSFTYVLTNRDMVGELPRAVLNHRKGYVPRVNENGNWFVKEFGTKTINGAVTDNAFIKTLRYFSNEHEAKQYIQQLIDKGVEAGEGSAEVLAKKYQLKEDREMEIASTALGGFSHGGGGLYTGARAEDALLYGINGDKATRVSPYEAMIRNITNVSKTYPINQWRMGLEQRWLNTAKALFPEHEIKAFGEIPSNIESTKKGQFLNAMARQINHWKGFPTKSEQLWQGTQQSIYEWAVGKEHKNVAKISHYLKDKDPVAAGRAAAFHTLLGWFNPVQLWTQAQGMSIAVSLSAGENLTDVMRLTTGLTVLGEHVGKVPPGRIKLAAKAAGVDHKDLLDIHEAWAKTGLADGILQTADHAAAIRGHGYAMDALKRASDKGLIFYRAGEFLTRRTAFSKAFLDWKKASNGAKLTDEALKGILDQTNNMMLNMGKANAASFQKGLLSLPFQFVQITTKAAETILGTNGNFTRAQRGRILAGQLALYGTAGIPLASLGVNYLKEVAGFTQEDLDNNPLVVKTVNDGFWGFITMGIMGVDAEVSSRGSLVRGVSDFIDNWVFAESSVGVKLTGAFGATGQRFWDELMDQTKPLRFNDIPVEDLNPLAMVTMPFLKSTSTFSNVERAVFLDQLGMVPDKHGTPIFKKSPHMMDLVMQGMGFQMSESNKAFSMTERVHAVQQLNKKRASYIVERMYDDILLRQAGLMTPEREEETTASYGFLMGSLDPESRKAVTRMVENAVGGDSKYARAVKKYRQFVDGRTADGVNEMKAALTGTEQLSIQEEN